MIKYFTFILLLLAPTVVFGHGKLTIPVARGGVGYENDPIGANDGTIFTATQTEAWVCRHSYNEDRQITATWNANQYETVEWFTSAPHVGDCELFLSPDYDAPLADMRWFKIAGYFNCRQHSQEPLDLWIPNWIKGGRYVLRWGWYALHNYPDQLEFFVQCSDIVINSPVTEFPTELQMYKLLKPTPLYPYNGQRNVGGQIVKNYRHPFPPSTDTWQTGPSCALCWTVDSCNKGGHQQIQNGCENSVSSTHGFLRPAGVEIPDFVGVQDDEPQVDYCNSFQCGANFIRVEYAAAIPCTDGGCTETLCCVPKVNGCTDHTATNYNAGANVDDGSCAFNDPVTQVAPVPNGDTDLYDYLGVYHGCASGIFETTSVIASDAWCQAGCVWSWDHCKDLCQCKVNDAPVQQEPNPNGDCATGTFIAFDSRASNQWCQANCEVNFEFCSVYCICSDDEFVDPDCASGNYYALDARATKDWCDSNCPNNWSFCSVYCGCEAGVVTQEAATTLQADPTQEAATTVQVDPTQEAATTVQVDPTQEAATTVQVDPTQEAATTIQVDPTQEAATTIQVDPTQEAATTIQVDPTQEATTQVVVDDVVVQQVLQLLRNSDSEEVFKYQKPDLTWEASTVYRWEDMISAVQLATTQGVAGMNLWVSDANENKPEYGLVNIAAFLANAMQETIRYNACDENNWSGPQVANEHGGVTYSAASACGQAGQSYQDYQCSSVEDDLARLTGGPMACEYDPEMEMRAFTQAEWYGAPARLFCAPKSKVAKAPRWDHSSPWCPQEGGWGFEEAFADDVPLDVYFEYIMNGGSCKDYEGIKTGGWKFTGQGCTGEGCSNAPAPLFGKPAGRTDVEGCCWWGRGVIQTTGICNFGKLNYYLGKRAFDEGRDSLYPTIDFCKNPNAICDPSSPEHLKWISGFFYWLNAVQHYESGDWNYKAELKQWVDNGMNLGDASFINGASGIVNRGCHNPPACGTGPLHGGAERRANFELVLRAMQLK